MHDNALFAKKRYETHLNNMILPRYFGHMERSDFMCYATS